MNCAHIGRYALITISTTVFKAVTGYFSLFFECPSSTKHPPPTVGTWMPSHPCGYVEEPLPLLPVDDSAVLPSLASQSERVSLGHKRR